ncbi:hypothetical protein FC20_GL001306 [Lactobacillus equicursoris DSM 19284 = JCM 14600 = CIP 110162]|uniref:Uncharacterized protein n=1 Tax=Lactobacillus equicursoris DSM 19284 = JCM 14600 = CIP 110162 TaxID=1293597 RepID=A0A0R1LY12_9LACO|nr:hypothetical protein FC20_GL001306 [Lactobacillus equicursoris DSM 19284 = JCM 14600 = CIP 110162]
MLFNNPVKSLLNHQPLFNQAETILLNCRLFFNNWHKIDSTTATFLIKSPKKDSTN